MDRRRSVLAGSVGAALLAVGAAATLTGSTDPPDTEPSWCRMVDLATGEEVTVSCHFDATTSTTSTPPPSSTSTSTSTTSPPPPTTTTSTTSSVPSEPGFSEDFTGNTGLDRFDVHVFHRNVDVHGYRGGSGGAWTGDHDLACGSPDTQRDLAWDATDPEFGGGDVPGARDDAVYLCRDHLMTSLGDVDGYSIAAFSPAQTFDDVTVVSFDVNLTDLGTRQWWKVGVLAESDCPTLGLDCMYSDVAAADLPGLTGPGRLIATWGGGISGGHPGGMKIGDTSTGGQFTAGADKATRHPVTLADNGNGTITFAVADQLETVPGSFPDCPCRVVFYDHNYTPNKNDFPPFHGVQYGYTWHWDNVEVR